MFVIAPALLFPTPRRLVVLSVVPIIWFCARLGGDRFLPRTPMNASLSLMLAMVGVSMLVTFDLRYSLGKISGVILGILLFWAIARWVTNLNRLKVAVLFFLLAGAGLAIAGLFGAPVSARSATLAVVTARLPNVIRGVPGAEDGFNPNPVAGCLVLFVPLQIALLATNAHRWLAPDVTTRSARTGLIAGQALLLVLTAGTVVLMQSRGAWLGLVGAMVAFLMWHNYPIRMIAALAVVPAVLLSVLLGPTSLLGIALGRVGPGNADDVLVRLQIWSSALHAIRDSPLTGMGMNAFRKIMMIRYPVPLVTAHYKDPAHAHNHLLQAAVDLGIPGLIAYLSLWLVAGALLVVVYRASREPVLRGIAGGLGAGLIAHFAFSISDAVPLGSKVGVLFWLTLALTVGLHRTALAPQPD